MILYCNTRIWHHRTCLFLQTSTALYGDMMCRYSPLVAQTVNDDSEDKEEHGYTKTDGDELLHLRRSARVLSDTEEQAARPAVGGLAAADQTGNMWVHSKGEHEPTCACRYEAVFLLIVTKNTPGHPQAGLKHACVCVCVITLLTCKTVCHCLGGTCTLHRFHSSLHIRFHRICVSAEPEFPPHCLQRERARVASFFTF